MQKIWEYLAYYLYNVGRTKIYFEKNDLMFTEAFFKYYTISCKNNKNVFCNDS